MTANSSSSHFQQPLSDELRDAWASIIARRRTTPIDDHSISLLVFRMGDEKFCLPAIHIEEIINPGIIRPLPHSRKGLLRGVTNVRGRILLCVWLDRLLQVAPSTTPGAARLLVFKHEGWRFATVVDDVPGVRVFHENDEKTLPSTHAGEVFSRGWFQHEGDVIARLDEETLFQTLRRKLL